MSEINNETLNESFLYSASRLLNTEHSKDNFIQLNRLISDPTSSISKDAKEFDLSITGHISEIEQKNEELNLYQNQIQELKNHLLILDTKYEKMLEEKEILKVKMKEYVTDRDIILAFKLGTLSHFCYDKKIKFGYFKSEKTMDYGTFPCNLEKNPLEELECRWALLKSFINSKNDTNDTLKMEF
ncbi:uncharacterized protein LOC123688815 isoform X1 [Harmonia axyridis]|uniref:uncharacterized protein LOC123688815 isoform X1 n=1 Tax=Harmonia axyridis TaxID=115357 RepID=UPI001E277559|nr:uncharacterized protein LOC123688815 isoform X1 [Harmonia axyridis]